MILCHVKLNILFNRKVGNGYYECKVNLNVRFIHRYTKMKVFK